MLLAKLKLGHFVQHLGDFLHTIYYMYSYPIKCSKLDGQMLLGKRKSGNNYATIGFCSYTVAHIVGIFLFHPNLWNYFKNNLDLDLDNCIHSQLLLKNNLPMFPEKMQ